MNRRSQSLYENPAVGRSLLMYAMRSGHGIRSIMRLAGSGSAPSTLAGLVQLLDHSELDAVSVMLASVVSITVSF